MTLDSFSVNGPKRELFFTNPVSEYCVLEDLLVRASQQNLIPALQ